VELPDIRYTDRSGASIAFQVFGTGRHEVALLMTGAASHLELLWEEPRVVHVFERLARFARVVTYDRRGTGLSDPIEGSLTLERQADDLLAVIDAAGFRRPVFLGGSESSRLGVFAAATHPDRISGLVLFGSSVAGALRWLPSRREELMALIDQAWGSGRIAALYSPSLTEDARFMRFLARFERSAASPAMARRLLDMSAGTDLQDFLALVRVPTLVLHRSHDTFIPVERGRELAQGIPDARFVELDGIDNSIVAGDTDAALDEIEEFITGERGSWESDTVLATVLFTDIVDSTRRAAELGDREWAYVLAEHDRLVRQALVRYRGREIKTLGDGFLSTFDGPARAVRCAQEIERGLDRIGIEARAGLHTGEVQMTGNDVHGLAVNIAARIGALASSREVLVSSTVSELVVGSELRFEERGTHELKGIPGRWRLLRLTR
jgi:class 3 adenylate cyclase